MFSTKKHLFALAIVAALGGTVACNNSSKPAAEASKEVAAEGEKAPGAAAAASDIKVEELPFYAKGPVATVDGTEIPAERFNIIAERRAQQMPGNIPGQMLQIYKKQTADMVIDEFLIERKIAADKVEASPEEVTQALNEFKARFPDETVYASFLEHNKITEDVIRGDIAKDVALRKIIAKSHNLEVDEAKVKAFYEENKPRFEQQEEVQASHILLKIEEGADDATVAARKKEAEAIVKEARAKDADFAALAKAKSEGPSAETGGALDFFPKNRMVPEFSEAAFKLKNGEVSDPVRTQFGYHIIKVTDRRDARIVPFEEVQPMIEEQLKNEVIREAMTQFLEDLKKDVKIERHEDNLVVNAAAEAPAMDMPNLDDPEALKLMLQGLGAEQGGQGE